MPKKNREYWDGSESVNERGSIKTEAINRGLENVGHVTTEHGYVIVQSTNQSYADGSPYRVTFLEFIHGGRKWRRQYQEYFRPQTLVTLAKAFAANVVAGRAG